MRWIERLWRKDQRVKATPGRVAASASEGIIRSTNLLRIRLLEQASSRADRKRFESEACILECLLFEWFLRDVVVAVEFGRHTDAIRRALGERLTCDMDRSGSPRRCCWISADFSVSALMNIGTRLAPVSPCRSSGRTPGCGSPTRMSPVIG
jgi:hypothetical protein